MQLTKIFDETAERGFMETPPGMAHWAGTGPAGKTCRQCESFVGNGHYAGSNKACANQPKPGKCAKYRQMCRANGGSVPAATPSCKYFVESANPVPQRAP